MNRFERRVTLRVLGIHVAVVLFVLVQSFLHGCFLPRPKDDIIIFTEFGEAPSTPEIVEVEEMPRPEPPRPAPQQAEPLPKVTPPVEIPKPPITPQEVPEPTPKKQPDPPKPTWTPTPVDQIKVGEKVNDPAPKLTQEQISKALSNIVKPAPAPTAKPGNPNEIAAYTSLIYETFYRVWAQPASAAARPAVITFSISSTGRIKSWRLSTSSGDPNYDATVKSAMNAVGSLSRSPPDGYSLDDIQMTFKID